MSGGIRAAFALVAAVAAAAAASPLQAKPVATRNVTAQNALESQVLVQINSVRRSRGLASLRTSAGLRRAADAHSSAMATRGFFTHESADGTPFWKRVQRYYPRRRGTWSVGENLLWSSPDVDPAQALRMWLNSPAHRRILLTARWREIGLSAVHVDSAPGVYNGLPVTIVTADFGVRR